MKTTPQLNSTQLIQHSHNVNRSNSENETEKNKSALKIAFN